MTHLKCFDYLFGLTCKPPPQKKIIYWLHIDQCKSKIGSYSLSTKVMEAVTDAGMTQIDETVVMTTIAAGDSATDQELAPPAPPKKRLVETDIEVRRA